MECNNVRVFRKHKAKLKANGRIINQMKLFIIHSMFKANVYAIPQQLKSLLADSERVKLTKKLSEANQQNRFLKRQVCMCLN